MSFRPGLCPVFPSSTYSCTLASGGRCLAPDKTSSRPLLHATLRCGGFLLRRKMRINHMGGCAYCFRLVVRIFCACDQKCASYVELLIRVYVFQNRWSSEKSIDRQSRFWALSGRPKVDSPRRGWSVIVYLSTSFCCAGESIDDRLTTALSSPFSINCSRLAVLGSTSSRT